MVSGRDLLHAAVKALLACDKFKGSLSAGEAVAAIAEGLGGDWEIERCPIADGGEGFVEAMLTARQGVWVEAAATDALGRPIVAKYGISRRSGATEAFIEMSEASGLWRIDREARHPRRSSTEGTGRLLRHAIEVFGAKRVYLGIGGSATNDGGAGLAAALGVRFLDEQGVELAPWPEALAALVRIDEAARIELPEIVVACDVDHPLTGPRGASAVFGPQKGAGPEDVVFLDGVLSRLARVAAAEDQAQLPGAGAAGGLGFGLVRFAGARLVSGFELVAEALELRRRIAAADLVITGEGSLDAQTLGGKGPAGVAALARELGVPVVAVAGRVEPAAAALFDACLTLESFGLPPGESIARAGELVSELIRNHAGLLRGLAAG